jgi:hypothetical protein
VKIVFRDPCYERRITRKHWAGQARHGQLQAGGWTQTRTGRGEEKGETLGLRGGAADTEKKKKGA